LEKQDGGVDNADDRVIALAGGSMDPGASMHASLAPSPVQMTAADYNELTPQRTPHPAMSHRQLSVRAPRYVAHIFHIYPELLFCN